MSEGWVKIRQMLINILFVNSNFWLFTSSFMEDIFTTHPSPKNL